MRHPRRARVVLVITVVAIVAIVAIVLSAGHGPSLSPTEIAAQQYTARIHREYVAEQDAADAAKARVAVRLPTGSGRPAPVAGPVLFRAPLPAHHVVGYVPYYTLDTVTSADLAAASEIVYSSVCPATNGMVATTGTTDCVNGYDDLATTAVADLVANAHADRDRVLLSVEATDDALIEGVDSGGASVARSLAANLVALERAHGFDGTNIDFEGSRPADREGYVRFVAAFTAALRADYPSGEIILDSYADAAAGPASFFDPAKLAPHVDAVFVMDYSLESTTHASAGAPLVTDDLGYSAVQSLIEYEKIVPADKLILGMPFYGFDFTTATSRPGAAATTEPEVRFYGSIEKAGVPVLWDPGTETPFSRFRSGGAWHQVWFDDPVSLALKVALAADLHTAGVGAWAFGMENGNPLMLAALAGGRSPLRTSIAR